MGKNKEIKLYDTDEINRRRAIKRLIITAGVMFFLVIPAIVLTFAAHLWSQKINGELKRERGVEAVREILE
jgi:hypothetical protein